MLSISDDEAADDDADEISKLVVIEDEPTLQIDESWCSSNDEDSESDSNHEVKLLTFQIYSELPLFFFVGYKYIRGDGYPR